MDKLTKRFCYNTGEVPEIGDIVQGSTFERPTVRLLRKQDDNLYEVEHLYGGALNYTQISVERVNGWQLVARDGDLEAMADGLAVLSLPATEAGRYCTGELPRLGDVFAQADDVRLRDHARICPHRLLFCRGGNTWHHDVSLPWDNGGAPPLYVEFAENNRWALVAREGELDGFGRALMALSFGTWNVPARPDRVPTGDVFASLDWL